MKDDVGMMVALDTMRRMHARASAGGCVGAALNYKAAVEALGARLRSLPRRLDPRPQSQPGTRQRGGLGAA